MSWVPGAASTHQLKTSNPFIWTELLSDGSRSLWENCLSEHEDSGCRAPAGPGTQSPGGCTPVHVVLGVEEPALLSDALRWEVGDGTEQSIHAEVV